MIGIVTKIMFVIHNEAGNKQVLKDVIGGYADWSALPNCTQGCGGGGVQHRNRSCDRIGFCAVRHPRNCVSPETFRQGYKRL